jgi:hypothetical protein
MPPVEFEPTISAGERPKTYALGYGYIGARNDTTQQSGQTPDKEVEIKNITVYVSGYTETDPTECYLPRLSGVNKVSLFRADSLARYLLQCA